MTEQTNLLSGRYELDQVIGRGGMAEVWRARDMRLQRDVAVKRLRLDLASDPTFQERFRREAKAAAGLNHPNIVAVYDTGEQLDAASNVMVPYIVMELVEGVTLREVLRGGRKIVPEKALEFAAGVLDALAYSHRAGIIHRDIKPANVMFTTPGTVKVMDFGIARAVADTSATMTQTAAVIGTAQYLSPEQARGHKVDNRSDIYAVGCLLYELLVSEPPFKGDSPVSVVFQHVREMPVPPSQRDPEITPDMDAIVLRALAKDPRDRYQDASEMREDIIRVLNHQPLPHRMAPQTEAPTQVIASDPITATARRAAPPIATVPPHSEQPLQPAEEWPAEEEVVEEPRKKTPMIVLGVLGGLVLIGIVVALVTLFSGGPTAPASPSPSPSPSLSPTESPSPTVQPVKVPKLEGLAEQDAVESLRKLGLAPKVEYVEGKKDQAGKVEGTDPRADTEVVEGAVVTVRVYKAPETIRIPATIVGMTEAQAREELIGLGFAKGNIKTVKADPASEPITAKPGTVVSLDPSTEAGPDATIILTIATGESRVPALTSMTPGKATEEAKKAGFEIEVRVVETNTELEGVVFEQNPREGTTLARSEKITVSVARNKSEPTSPSSSPSATPGDQ
ncbi:Stk1 family PASTA domain-containing Ser/Thr kinase [Tessaracoccus sp. OH4464_COT-324]|uniref:Stk1 family PASTA domain-containing Ser/Thr kinase n=1 Tax=Tessaracoccus sp. OH4464_COT-324 TaxID=2491059 RepID=UPI000F63F365|nr:Stk1 family PASTA domain-containing Ser/Thr kinase [Tessaracoccus sp. OH4464_COT-324]RRD45928.1 Stk1 family PASTA domain-containing Ser/Thr kinase [Tessaracoccus sp. OH4464_COT-324]